MVISCFNFLLLLQPPIVKLTCLGTRLRSSIPGRTNIQGLKGECAAFVMTLQMVVRSSVLCTFT